MIKGYVEWREKRYGMKFLSLEEELALSESERSTRNCKFEIIDICEWLKQYVEQLEDYARKIPVEDDARHAEMVRRLRDKVRQAEIPVDDAVLWCLLLMDIRN